MVASRAYKIMWSTGLFFVILPHLNLGLLSDYKICGDSGCESPMSRVRAIRDHHGKDCRFLSFRQGDTIFVYHKLTGEREDLWAGGIDKQFGYFPKDAVKEEQVHSTVEKVVETQESDFFCMDEFGRPIDSSHLDSDDKADDNADNDNEKIQNQESETTQTTPYADNTKSETPSKTEDVSAEDPVSAPEADGTSAEEDENKIAPEAAAGTHEEAQETPEAADEQGGSASSAWLGSSVTGWLGLTTEEGPVNLAEGVGEDERKETQAEAPSFASSLTGWLGFGGEKKPGDAVGSTEEDKRQSDDSITSTMTGWLGFGGGEKTDHSVEKEQDEEREAEKEQEPAETFRSRRMSLDLEGSQIYEEEKEEMGTLDWLGNGLSNTLGFGTTNQESERERTSGGETEETIQEEEKQLASGSWFDIGINDILGLRGDKRDDDEKTGGDFKETEEDKTLEQPLDSENVDTSQSQPTLTQEVRTETSDESKTEETPEDQNVSAEMETVTETETVTDTTEPVTADRDKNDFDSSDGSKNILLPEDAASELDQNDISPQNKLKKNTQAEGGVSSVLDVFFQTSSEEEEEDNLSHDNKTETKVLDTEKEDKDHQMLKSVENEGDDNNQEPAEEEMKAKSDTDQGFSTQSGIKLEPDFSSNSAEESVSAAEEEKPEDEVEEKEEIPHQNDNTEASPDLFVKDGASGDGHEGERSDVETDELQRDIYTSQTDDSAEHKEKEQESSGDSQSYLSSDTTEERNEPVSDKNGMLTVHSKEADASSSDPLAMTGRSTEAEMHHEELGQEAEGQVKGSLPEFGSFNNTEIVLENATEEDKRTFSAESTAQMEENLDQNPASPQQNDSDAHMIKETVNETEEDENNLQSFETETKELDKNTSNESSLRSAAGPETGSEEVEEMQGELQEEDVKALERQQGEEEEEEKQESEEEEVKQFEKHQEVEKEKQEEMEELIEEGKHEETEESEKEEKQEEEKTKDEDNQRKEEELKEDEEVRAFEKQQEMERERQDEVEEFKKEEKQEEIKVLENEKKQEVEEETKDEENQKEEEKELKEAEEVKPPEKQQEVVEEKQDEVEEMIEEGKHEETKELEKEEKQEVGEETNEENQRKEEEPKKEKEVKPFENRQEVEEETDDEVEELKEEEKQEKSEELENEKKQDVEEETKEEENQEKEEEKLKEVMGSKEDEEMENLKKEKEENLKELKVDERGENLKGVEEVNEEEKKVSEEKQVQLSHSEEEVEQSERSESEGCDKDTQGEISLNSVLSETSTQTEKMGTENQQIEKETIEEENKRTKEVEEEKDELKEEEVELKEEIENVENEGRDQEEEEGLKCLNEPCPQASEDGFVKDTDGNDSANRLGSIDEGETETGRQKPMADTDQILAVKSVVSHTVPSDSTERDEDRKQEEENRNNDAEAGEGETKTNESSLTGNEEVKSISDPNALGVNQIKKSDCKDNDQLCSGESGQSNLPDHIMLSQRAENKEDQRFSSEVKSINPSDDNMLHQEDQTKPEYTETNGKKAEQIHSDQKIETKEDTDREERQMNGKHDDVKVSEGADMQMKEGDGSTVGTEGGTEISVSSSDPDKDAQHESQHASGSSVPSDDHSEGKTKTEGGGAFGLLKNAFRFFSPTPASETTESAPSLDSNTGEPSEPQESLTPEQEVDFTTDSTQVYTQDLHTDSLITLSQQQQQQPSPTPSPSIQTSSPSPVQNIFNPSPQSLKTGSSPQAKTLSKLYKNLLTYMNVDEMTVLIDLFGGHKLQFLDYMLGSSDGVTDDPDNDESILSDIERLLHYHKETLVSPGVSFADAPQEDEERNRPLIALQNFEQLLVKVRETFNAGKSDISNAIHQAMAYKDKEIATKEESSKVTDSSVGWDNNNPRDQWMGEAKKRSGQPNGGTGKEGVNEDEKRGEKERSEENRESHLHIQAGPSQPQEGVLKQTLDFVHQIAEYSTTHIHEAKDLLILLTVQVVSSLPDDIRPGPDLYGVPWEPVIITSMVGLMTMLLFTCRCYSSVKSRMYRSKERWLAEQVAQMLDEKCKVLETLSKCQQEYDELESSLRDSSVLAQTQKTEHLQGRARELEHAKRELERDIEQLNDQLDQQREHRMEQERRIAALEESMKTFEEEIKDLQSQEEQAQTTLKVYNMNSERLQRNLETAREENTLLQESNAQLRQQVEGWAERVSDIEAEMSRCEVAHHGMLQDVANKDERIMSLTDRLLRMKAWDSELEAEEGEEGGEKETSNGTAGGEAENGKEVDAQSHLQKVQKLIYAAKLNADLKSVDEDKDRAFAKLNDEVKAKEDLLEGIKELEKEKLSLQSDTEHFSDQVQRLQQKLNIMTEMYQENELKLHRMLTVEEKERLQKEEKLHKADKNIALALEELNNYRQRAQEMEEELEKTKQSYQTQMSAHEKKAHNNWLAARAADRELADNRRENALLRQKLTDTQFKLDALDKDPYALNSLARPLPFRGERSPYGPSPLGRPASETRAFLSPPTLMDGPPARLSPRVPRVQMEPQGGQGEMERSGGPHSDSGSNSPTWERDRRGPPPGPPGPLGPPGYMFPEPGGPMYRRPLPPPGPLGILPPPGSIPPGPLHIRGLPPGPPPHPADMSDVAYRENSLGPGEQEHREQSGSGDRRTPPDTDPRIGGIPPPGPPMGPMDGPFPRRAPYGPPPPDFFPPRGPGGPPMMPMWNPPPPGMMFPPRFPPGGPPLPPVSHHAPPMRPPFPDGLPPPSMGPPPPQQSFPSPPQSQSPEEHKPSPEDAI